MQAWSITYPTVYELEQEQYRIAIDLQAPLSKQQFHISTIDSMVPTSPLPADSPGGATNFASNERVLAAQSFRQLEQSLSL